MRQLSTTRSLPSRAARDKRACQVYQAGSLAQRCAARRERIVVHRAKDHTDADQWDLEFWQNQTPEMRLLALMELRNDLSKIRGRNRMFDDE